MSKVTIDLGRRDDHIENEVETTLPVPLTLQPRINDVTTFGDESE